MRTIGLVMVMVMVLAAAGAGLAGCGVSNAQADRFLAEQARVAGEAVMSSLNSRLRDPRSTRWGAVWAHGGRVCGTFNPKNGAGVYGGPRRFVGRKGGTVFVDGVSSLGGFEAEWDAYCGHAHLLVKAGEPPGPAIHPMTPDERAAEQAAFGTRPLRLERGGGVKT